MRCGGLGFSTNQLPTCYFAIIIIYIIIIIIIIASTIAITITIAITVTITIAINTISMYYCSSLPREARPEIFSGVIRPISLLTLWIFEGLTPA